MESDAKTNGLSQNIFTRSPIAILLAFSLVYLTLFFPYAYFRHDDWVIIGNGVLRLPRDWSFAFEPTLILNSTEVVWFFRPLFKVGAYLFFNLFGYHYFAWLTATLILTVAALALSFFALMRLTQSRSSSILFLILFTCSMQFHFGSIIWIGEGLMNCPVMFLLALNTWCFVTALQSSNGFHRFLYQVGGLLAFLVSLGFKEIGILHTMFLFCLVTFEPNFKKIKLKDKGYALFPYFVTGSLFLIFRLLILPVNPGYVPQLDLSLFGFPLFAIVASLVFPVVALIFYLGITRRECLQSLLRAMVSRWLYFVFLLISIFPYLGHSFFSAGWLLLPGYYLSFILALALPRLTGEKNAYAWLGVFLLISSALPVLWKTKQLYWWDWHQSQRQIIEVFKSADSNAVKEVNVFLCARNSETTLDRVVGSTDSLGELWEVIHGKRIPMKVHACPENWRGVGRPVVSRDRLDLIWDFPEFVVVK